MVLLASCISCKSILYPSSRSSTSSCSDSCLFWDRYKLDISTSQSKKLSMAFAHIDILFIDREWFFCQLLKVDIFTKLSNGDQRAKLFQCLFLFKVNCYSEQGHVKEKSKISQCQIFFRCLDFSTSQYIIWLESQSVSLDDSGKPLSNVNVHRLSPNLQLY